MTSFNEDFTKVTSCNLLGPLPDVLEFDDGSPVDSPDKWQKRRAEIRKTAVDLQFGHMPPEPEFLEVETLYIGDPGSFRTYRIITGTRANPVTFTMMVRLPYNEGKFPAVIDGDLCFPYIFRSDFLDTFTDNNVAFVFFNRTELVPDIREAGRNGPLYRAYPDHDFGAIGAWAWGYSRCVDALEKLDIVDMDCIAFTGHSRGGKTAMLAGALDERAAIVNPNASGAGGCGCYRVHMTAITEDGDEGRSETLKDLLRNFDFWMGPGMADYTEREEEIPFDEHFLKAMAAPRVLLLSDAASDMWANPIGTWYTTEKAKEVWKMLGCEENILWHFRTGYHFHDVRDAVALVNVIRHVKYGEPISDNFFKKPFKTDLKP